jgi:hypothetical protein
VTIDQADERPSRDDTDALDRAIGRAVRSAAQTEWLLGQLYQLLICSPHAATLAAGISFNELCDSIAQLADASWKPAGFSAFEGRRIDATIHGTILDSLATARKLARRRNAVVHGYWGVNGWDTTEHVTLLSKRRRADPEVAYWKPATLEELAASYTDLDAVLYRLIEGLLEIPPQPLLPASAGG